MHLGYTDVNVFTWTFFNVLHQFWEFIQEYGPDGNDSISIVVESFILTRPNRLFSFRLFESTLRGLVLGRQRVV